MADDDSRRGNLNGWCAGAWRWLHAVAVLALLSFCAVGQVTITGGGTGVRYYTLTPGGSTGSVGATVTCVNDAPVLSTTGSTLAYTRSS